ncbi:MAG: SH3 domain-containing protein [Clostridia bacterium]|nr:SH3 domain-containing protein [Clostridia bacterium]
MTKTPSTKKMMKLLLAFAATVVIFFAMSLSASAASYPTIKLDVPRVSQCPGRGDCAIASMATIEAYCHDLPSGNHNSKAYQAVYSANGNSISAMWPKLGYKPIDGFSMTTVYNQLKTGYPVIVHRTSQHYSVIYGYDGSSSQLEISGFLVVDVDDSYNSSTAYFRLNNWKRSGSLDRMVIRQNGLAISTSGVNITTNHPAQQTAKGESFKPDGVIVSDKNLTEVKVKVATENGTAKQSFSATPNAKSYNLSNASAKIDISSLAIGNYIYSITAKNADGNSDFKSFTFSIGVAPTPPAQSQPNVDIKDVSYKAFVLADPSLNMRKGAGIEYDRVTSIPYGSIIDVTGEYDGWARVKYNGMTGWVSLEYITKELPAPDVDDGNGTTPPTAFSSYYARVINSVALKESASVFARTIATVPEKSVVKVTGESDGWIRFTYNGKTGWARTSFFVTKLGDTVADGNVNSADALAVLQYSTGVKSLNSQQVKVSDFNGDGKANSADALVILQVATGAKKFD